MIKIIKPIFKPIDSVFAAIVATVVVTGVDVCTALLDINSRHTLSNMGYSNLSIFFQLFLSVIFQLYLYLEFIFTDQIYLLITGKYNKFRIFK